MAPPLHFAISESETQTPPSIFESSFFSLASFPMVIIPPPWATLFLLGLVPLPIQTRLSADTGSVQKVGHSCNILHNQTFFKGYTEEALLHNGLFGSANVHFPETYTQEGRSACDKKKVEPKVIHLLAEPNVERAMGRTHPEAESSSTNS